MAKRSGEGAAARQRKTAGGTTGLSKRIRKLRVVVLKMNQAELGEKLGVKPQTISQWEKDNLPSIDNLRELARVGSVTLDWLLEGRNLFEERLGSMSDERLRILRDYLDVMLKLRAEGMQWVVDATRPPNNEKDSDEISEIEPGLNNTD